MRVIRDDLHRYARAYRMIASGTPAREAIKWYLRNASPGLKAYQATYGVDAEDLLRRVTEQRRFYASMADIDRVLSPYLGRVHSSAERLYRLAPATRPVPIYMFVGAMGHGATVKELVGGEEAGSLGVLMPVEHVAAVDAAARSELEDGGLNRAGPGDLPQFTSHELTHVAQVDLQSLSRYRSIYTEPARGTHLAYAIREGGADFLAFLSSGQLRQRHAFYLAREQEIWREFAALRNLPAREPKGWFSGRDETRPDRPPQLGYAVGWAMCRHFYAHSPDKPAALRFILSAVESDHFDRIAAPYARHRQGS